MSQTKRGKIIKSFLSFPLKVQCKISLESPHLAGLERFQNICFVQKNEKSEIPTEMSTCLKLLVQ